MVMNSGPFVSPRHNDTMPTAHVTSQRHPARRQARIDDVERSHGRSSRSAANDQSRQGCSPARAVQLAKPVHIGQSAHRAGTLSAADDAILRLFAAYQFLSADQVRRLRGYRAGSLDYVRCALKCLVQSALVMRTRLPRASAGNAPWVYGLDRAGLAYLLAAGADPLLADSGRFRTSEQYERSYLFLAHTLAVNDFLIAATLLERHTPEVTLAAMRHERELRRTPVRISLGVGEQQVVIPDGWLDFHLGGRSRLCVAVELDRGTEEERAFKRKIRALLEYAAGPYQEAFGTDSLTIAFATTAGLRREERMRTWCEQVLRSQQQEHDADLFFLASLPEGELDPRTVFLSAIWSRPFATDHVPLLVL